MVALKQAAGTTKVKTNEKNNNKTKEPKQPSKEYDKGTKGVLLGKPEMMKKKITKEGSIR